MSTVPPGRPTEGARLVAEFDVDPDAWYFRDNPSGVMPYCVLLEAILQPCGWLGSYMGFAMAGDEDTCFRNLDGNEALMTAEVGPDAGTLRVEVTATSSARAGDMSLVFYDVQSFVGDRPVLRLRTSFGFFKISALRNQAGLSANDRPKSMACEANRNRLRAGLVPGCRRQAAHGRRGDGIVDRRRRGGSWPHSGTADRRSPCLVLSRRISSRTRCRPDRSASRRYCNC